MALDAAVALWIALWIVMAFRVAHEVRDVGRIGETVARVGSAVAETGATIKTFGDLPVVGSTIAEAGAPIEEAGHSARASALQTRESARDLSWLLGLSIAVVPTLPLLLLYVPRRVAFELERRMVARTVLAAAQHEELQRTLALRAIARLPFDRLLAITTDPNGDIVTNQCEALASAELDRLELDVPASWHPDYATR